jgi:hypothetical protein
VVISDEQFAGQNTAHEFIRQCEISFPARCYVSVPRHCNAANESTLHRVRDRVEELGRGVHEPGSSG